MKKRDRIVLGAVLAYLVIEKPKALEKFFEALLTIKKDDKIV